MYPLLPNKYHWPKPKGSEIVHFTVRWKGLSYCLRVGMGASCRARCTGVCLGVPCVTSSSRSAPLSAWLTRRDSSPGTTWPTRPSCFGSPVSILKRKFNNLRHWTCSNLFHRFSPLLLPNISCPDDSPVRYSKLTYFLYDSCTRGLTPRRAPSVSLSSVTPLPPLSSVNLFP